MQTPLTARETFKQAIAKVNAGQPNAAAELCRVALKQYPNDVNMLGLLGAVLLKMNNIVEAETYLRRTVELAPTFAKPHEDLGLLLLRKNDFAAAAHVLRKATRLDPSLASAHFNLGKALAQLGKGKEADIAFEKSFEQSPTRKALAQATELHKAGKLQEAERIYHQVLLQDAGNIDAMRRLALIAAAAHRSGEATRLLRKVIAKAPDFFIAHMDLGSILKDQDYFEEAIECFKTAIKIDANNAQAHFLLASTLAPAALTYEAVDAYKACLDITPNHPGALLGLGHVMKTIGHQEEGIAAYRKCIAVKPGNGETYWSLANLKTFRFADTEIAEMEEQVNSGKMDNEQSAVNFLFALAKAYEDRQDYQKAWQYYEQANSRQRVLVSYDPVHNEVTNDDIIEVFTESLLREKCGQGDPDSSPIFILGLPRSGSTLLEQIIASHSMVEGIGELPYLGRVITSLNRNRADGINYPQAVNALGAVDFQSLGEDYLGFCRMHRQQGVPRFIDKMPNNFPHIGMLLLMLPNAKVIDARRHPLDACLGNYKQLYAKGQPFTYDLTDIGEYYLQYQRMMDHWDDVSPGRVLRVQYEDTVLDLENQVRRILDYLELPWEDVCLNYHQTDRPVRTASSAQVRQPIYTGAINFWRNYEQQLDELIEVIAPIRERYRAYESINS